jgi:hypothetical protein
VPAGPGQTASSSSVVVIGAMVAAP